MKKELFMDEEDIIMNDTCKAQIDATFEKLHQDASTAYGNVYDSIQRQLKDSSSRGLSGEIAQLEARKLNQEILQLTDAVKQAAISEMIACGCKPYLTQAGWTEIQQAAGLPHTELCKVQVDIMHPTPKTNSAGSATAANAAASRNRELEALAEQYGITGKVLAGIAGVGVAAVVVSLFIPGWDFPVKVLCAAGAIVAIVGGGAAFHYDNKRNETLSKFEHVGKQNAPKAQDSAQLDSIVKQITDSQYKRNLKLYDEWLEQVKQVLITECDKLSAM